MYAKVNNAEPVLKEFTIRAAQSKSAKRPMTGKSNSLLVNLKELFQKKVWEANEGTSMES